MPSVVTPEDASRRASGSDAADAEMIRDSLDGARIAIEAAATNLVRFMIFLPVWFWSNSL
ncbi:MAG: hypothetical protein ABJ370_07400 [Paracoccaceae bacterium]